MLKEETFTKIIKEHEGIIYKITRVYTNSNDDQKDLYQEVVYQLWKSFDSFRGEAKVSTWIYRIALNTALFHLKKGKREGHKVSIENLILKQENYDPVLEDRLQLLYAHIRTLSDLERGIVLLFLEGKKHEEIALITGFSTTNIGTRISRIKQKLKKTNYKRIITMELEEMQTAWSEMSIKLEKQEILTNKLIMEMTEAKYRSKISIVSKYEGIGAIICFIMAIILITKLKELDTWYLLASGIFVIVYLITIPAIVLRSIKKMRNLNITDNNYKQTLIDYANNRKQFLFIQRVGIYLNFLLMLVALPMFVKLSSNKDIFVTNTSVWYWYVPIMTLFLIFFSRWGYKSYKSITASAEKTLKELE